MARQEFKITGAFRSSRSSAVRWIVSHVFRHKGFVALLLSATILANLLGALIPTRTGAAFNQVLEGEATRRSLLIVALSIIAIVLLRALFNVSARFASEFLANRFARDARDELVVSLLGKSQTFHNRQRVGDIMARSTNDVTLLRDMVTPGMDLIVDSTVALIMPLIFIGLLDPRLLLAPLCFVVAFAIALRLYMRQISPVAQGLRAGFSTMNAGLAETIGGIDVVKATAQEGQESAKFRHNARHYRDLWVENGNIQARYLPMLLLSIATAGALLHGVILVNQGDLSIGGLVTYIGLMWLLGFPAEMGIWTFNLVGLGIVAAGRILTVINEETELDENEGGCHVAMRGEIVFENVSFSYNGAPVLENVSFRAMPGQTVALVGQTGSGKSTLTKLVNRIYDADAGRVLVDGVDVRDWRLDALRSQISAIEQDIFLFSRSIRENITFSTGGTSDAATVERAARDAQAHEFISGFKDGYETVIGERGVTLSGGQRQRIAIARALLTDPRILILDDSTSAIDSATEDEIQKAIRRLLEGRTTLLITHRLSQIRWADQILVLRNGRLVDQGTHDELLRRSTLYRRMFTHYDEATIGNEPSAVGNGQWAQGGAMFHKLL
ncbi:MAG: ABC transporter ATP-binding protein, partial [Dehalococcoidia bacterium]